MNWHLRYVQQAGWTRELRKYLFDRCGWPTTKQVLEVGCGTGAVLMDPAATGQRNSPQLHGIDLSAAALAECRANAPEACLTRGDANSLPYESGRFDIAYCHYLLLWLKEPLCAIQEMKRVTARRGYVLAFAEPDYASRTDRPAEMAQLGRLQNESLVRQGAALSRGSEVAELFRKAGIQIIETGRIMPDHRRSQSFEDWQQEWQVLRADLPGLVDAHELDRFNELDRAAWQRGEHQWSVPTYFVWGQV